MDLFSWVFLAIRIPWIPRVTVPSGCSIGSTTLFMGQDYQGPGGGKGWLGGWGALLKQQNIRELFRYSAAEMFFPEYHNICIFVFQTWAQVVNQDFPGTRVWSTDYCHKPVLDEQTCNAIDGSTFVPSGNQIWPAGIPKACVFKFIYCI